MSYTEIDEVEDRPAPLILPMPATIAAAIVAVKRKVKTIPKSESNQYANYNYTSADAFMQVISPLEAEAGLTIIQQQSNWELRKVGTDSKPRFVIFIEYSFFLCHESGEMWMTPLIRTVNVDAAGAQAWGAAQTYALKQLQRSLYQVPTGEEDADASEGAKLTASPRPAGPPQGNIRPFRSTGGEGQSSTGYITHTTGGEPPSSVSLREMPFPEVDPSPAEIAERLAPVPHDTDMAGRFLAAISRRETVEEVNDIWRQFRDGPARNLSKADQTRAGNGYIKMIERLQRMRQPQENPNG